MLRELSESIQVRISSAQKEGKYINARVVNQISEELVKDLEIDALLQDIIDGLYANPKYNIFRDVYGNDFDDAKKCMWRKGQLSKSQFKAFNKALMMSSEAYYQNGLQIYDTIIRAFYRVNKNYNVYRSRYGSGCYIATSVYGNYNHPQVLKLRYFRDEILARSLIGKIIIKFYYLISPLIVKIFGKSKKFNIVMQRILEKFIHKFVDYNH